ncbi:MFS transporter [Streptomyces millisiae]|uniref:MFS transporter n=1 Tax=Streptomyces millisiae TaxID=3075542 RepID=A0ABU2M146_9ACTN|nr:MFS transporter [Streptomyces sp. DSM 44918]MDT0323574.1 MFS transporter [Streptomyces sp. DSM 44918]
MTNETTPAAAVARPPLGPAYWRLLTSSAFSNLADGVLKVALPLVAIQYTRSPTLIAGLSLALSLPWLLFALQAGALADRLDRRRAMVFANCLRTLLMAALALAVALDAGSVWLLYAVAFCVGVAETVYDTSAQSIVPQLVHRDQLARANGRLYAAELAANQFVGPAVAGLLVAAGAVAAFAAPTALWAVAVAALLLVPGTFRTERTGPATTMRADIAEGLRYLWNQRLLRTLAAMVGASNFASNAAFAVLVLYAVGPTSAMGLTEGGFGVLMTAMAVGSLLGSFVAEWAERALGPARALSLTVLTSALALAVPALTADPYLVGAGFAVSGVGIVIWNVITVSLRQRIVPNGLLGRLNSGYRLIAWGTMPLGAVAGGVLAQLFGLRAVFAITAVVVLLTLVGMAVVTDAALRSAERSA